MSYTLTTRYKKLLADTYSPVSIYLKLRDRFPNSILLESSDYHGQENSFSFICCKPIASIKAEGGELMITYPDGKVIRQPITPQTSVPMEIKKFSDAFQVTDHGFKFINNGMFGYISYDAVNYFEDIDLQVAKKEGKKIPDILYSIYQYVIAIDHFKEEMYLFEHCFENTKSDGLKQLESYIANKNFASYPFQTEGDEVSNYTDEAFINLISKGKAH